MKILLIIAGVPVALVVLACLIGALLPAEHSTAREVWLPAPPERVFTVLTDVAAYPQWRPDVLALTIVADDPLRFRERGRDGEILFEVDERQPPRHLVVRIADPSLPFGGRWTYALVPENDGTRLTIREDGVVHNVFFRFVSRFIVGHAATIERYLTALSKRMS